MARWALRIAWEVSGTILCNILCFPIAHKSDSFCSIAMVGASISNVTSGSMFPAMWFMISSQLRAMSLLGFG